MIGGDVGDKVLILAQPESAALAGSHFFFPANVSFSFFFMYRVWLTNGSSLFFFFAAKTGLEEFP